VESHGSNDGDWEVEWTELNQTGSSAYISTKRLVQFISSFPLSHYKVLERDALQSLFIFSDEHDGGGVVVRRRRHHTWTFFETFCTIVFIWVSSLWFLNSFFKIRHGFEQIYACIYVLGFQNFLLISSKLNPILTYFTCWWWIYALIRRINGESSWFLKLGFHFNFFRIFSNFHFNSPLNLSFRTFDDDYELNEKELCTYLSWFGDSNEILQKTLNLGCVLDASGKFLHRNWK
jgi:hypothetical protein